MLFFLLNELLYIFSGILKVKKSWCSGSNSRSS